MNTDGVFLQPAAPDELERLREHVDTGAPFDTKFTAQAVGQTLLELIGSLSEYVLFYMDYIQFSVASYVL